MATDSIGIWPKCAVQFHEQLKYDSSSVYLFKGIPFSLAAAGRNYSTYLPQKCKTRCPFSKIAVQAEGESFYFSEASPAWLKFTVLQKQNLSVYLGTKITLTTATVTADVEQFSTVSSNVPDTQSSVILTSCSVKTPKHPQQKRKQTFSTSVLGLKVLTLISPVRLNAANYLLSVLSL